MHKDATLIFQPPSPPFRNVMRDYAGGYGIAGKSSRTDYGHEGGLVPCVSLLYGAAVLRKAGFDICVIDGQAEQLSKTATIERVRDVAPALIVSVLSLPSMTDDLDLLASIRAQLPWVKVVCIGTLCKELYKDVLAHDVVTAVVRGDAEVVLPGLVAAMLGGGELDRVPGIAYRDDRSEVVVTSPAAPLTDLDSLPMPPYDLLAMDRYWHGNWGREVKYMEVLDSRGCPYQCASYCPYPFGFGNKPLLKIPTLVVDEVEYLHREFGTEAFIFRGQNFTLIRRQTQTLCHEMLRRGLRVRWVCETRLDAVDEPTLRLMKEAGCERVHYGLESGDPELFAKVAKPGRSIADFGASVAQTIEAGMQARVNIVLGLPGENWKTVRKTIDTIRAWKPSSVLAAVITPYPGTPLYDEAKRRNLLLTDDWSRFTGFDPVMRTEHMSVRDILAAKTAIEKCLDGATICGRLTRKISNMMRGAADSGLARR